MVMNKKDDKPKKRRDTTVYDKLTDKQREFVKRYCTGVSKRTAVEEVYNSSNPNIYAHELLQKPHVQQAINELNNLWEEETMFEKKKQLRDLEYIKDKLKHFMDLIEKPNKTKHEKEIIKDLKAILSVRDVKEAIDLQNKMLGLYEPDKLEVNENININFIEDDTNTTINISDIPEAEQENINNDSHDSNDNPEE